MRPLKHSRMLVLLPAAGLDQHRAQARIFVDQSWGGATRRAQASLIAINEIGFALCRQQSLERYRDEFAEIRVATRSVASRGSR